MMHAKVLKLSGILWAASRNEEIKLSLRSLGTQRECLDIHTLDYSGDQTIVQLSPDEAKELAIYIIEWLKNLEDMSD